jgi:hypothetical protein
VPFSNAANSNTPTGRSTRWCPACEQARIAPAVSGPMSRIMSSSSTSRTAFTVAGVSAAKALPHTTSSAAVPRRRAPASSP